MQGLQRILVATDFSEHAKLALERAIDLAERLGAELHVAHVFAPPLPFAAPYDLPPPDLYLGQARKECETHLGECAKQVTARGLTSRTTLLDGGTAQEIARFAGEIDADLVVVGTRGLTGVKHLLLGSVAERIAHQAPCSVWIVREDEA